MQIVRRYPVEKRNEACRKKRAVVQHLLNTLDFFVVAAFTRTQNIPGYPAAAKRYQNPLSDRNIILQIFRNSIGKSAEHRQRDGHVYVAVEINHIQKTILLRLAAGRNQAALHN